MSRLTYHFLQTALCFFTAIIFLDYLAQPIPAALLMLLGGAIAISGVGANQYGR